MSESIEEIENEGINREQQEMGSLNHSFTEGRITGLLFNDKKFIVMPELSLDVGQIDLSQFGLEAKKELKPDLCLYPKNGIHFNKSHDVPRMLEMPY